MPRSPRPSNHAKAWIIAALIMAAAIVAIVAWAALSPTMPKDESLGKAALQETGTLVNLGPRPSGSEAHRKMQAIIIERLKKAGLQVEENHFTAQTPLGPIPMNNITAKVPARAGASAQRTIILATHYDTKLEHNFPFVGANDGSSGTGLLMALAPVLAQRNLHHNIWLAFLDGEEAIQQWTDTDSLYGSRHLAAQLKQQGMVPQIGAFILLDMIGDADLGILRDSNSTAWLREAVWKAAAKLGYSRYFLNSGAAMEDDHIPMLQAGIPSVALIDYEYGPNTTAGGAYWHTAEDTTDKLSAHSLQVVGDVVLETLQQLDK